MAGYVRPPIEVPDFTDEDGTVISYGSRWVHPPEDSYSVTSNLERFEPIIIVTNALITYLRETYDVGVTETDITGPASADVNDVRYVEFRPRNPRSAPITITFTDFPGVRIRAGISHSVGQPSCGCDACDEWWEPCVDEIETLILAVAEGRFQESVGTISQVHSPPLPFTRQRSKPAQEYQITDASGALITGGGGSISTAEARALQESLDARGGSWEPWPLR